MRTVVFLQLALCGLCLTLTLTGEGMYVSAGLGRLSRTNARILSSLHVICVFQGSQHSWPSTSGLSVGPMDGLGTLWSLHENQSESIRADVNCEHSCQTVGSRLSETLLVDYLCHDEPQLITAVTWCLDEDFLVKYAIYYLAPLQDHWKVRPVWRDGVPGITWGEGVLCTQSSM